MADEVKPTVCLVIGMAGSGKTTFMQRLQVDMEGNGVPGYFMNLDPAVANIPYQPHVDIRDTIKFKEVMKQYGLGPNGGIMTSLNLFATRFDQVLDLCEKRSDSVDYICVDTPGQIEVFTWSASGMIITEGFAMDYPTVVVYVVDTPRSKNPITFMSNMLYACSIMYKTKLPFLLAFNKTDVEPHDFAVQWMNDLESFEEAVSKERSYMASFSRSMGLVLDEFYRNIKCVGVSAVTGEGMDDFYDALQESTEEYYRDYIPHMQKRIADKLERDNLKKEEDERKQEIAKEEQQLQNALKKASHE